MRAYTEHLADPVIGHASDRAEPTTCDGVSSVDVCAGGSCGVLARFHLDVDRGGRIVGSDARIRGAAAAFATASALCEAAQGRTVLAAARLGLATLHPSFDQLTGDDRDRALVVEDAFHLALGTWARERMHDAPTGTGSERPTLASVFAPDACARVLVGMSGGIDSAVSLLRECAGADDAQRDVVGVTLRLWIDPAAPDPDAACCSPDSVRRARRTCHEAGVGHLSIDLRDAFTRAVVAPFVGAYSTGETPNPCVTCNGSFRLDELVRLADVCGAQHIVTGHYARLVTRDGRTLVARGRDRVKDQSYMLAEVEPDTLARFRFPLAAEDKRDVRVEARAAGLEQAELAESQEVCFLGGGDYRAFLRRHDALGMPGDIVLRSREGDEQVVGKHDGIARFTVGQRKGIGVAAPEPVYVHEVDAERGRVVVGPRTDELLTRAIPIRRLRWHAAHPASPETRVLVQVRYRMYGGAVAGRVVSDELIELDAPMRPPAPGQSLVIYDEDDVVLGMARIARARVQHL